MTDTSQLSVVRIKEGWASIQQKQVSTYIWIWYINIYIYIYDISYIHDISMFISLVSYFLWFSCWEGLHWMRQVGHEFETSGLGASSLADAILSAVGVALDDGTGRPFKGVGGWNWIQHGRCMYHYVSPRIFCQARIIRMMLNAEVSEEKWVRDVGFWVEILRKGHYDRG